MDNRDDVNITKIKPTRKYKCPFCEKRDTKEKLVTHVENEHEDMTPSTSTAAREVYNSINNRTCGSCVVCGDPTEWNEDRWKYNRLCGKPACKKALSDMADNNMKKVYGKTTLLNDHEQQEKMMFNRSISGKYTFSDGGVFHYVGSYEKKALEFMDKVMNIKSSELLVPGPIVEYEFEGKTLTYISDMYFIPYNLIIEVKDGGSNPNNRDMWSYRHKQDAKENKIIKDKKYNYIRLTDNKFDQLLDIFAELKYSMTIDSDSAKIVRINEEVGGMPGSSDYSVGGYIVPYGYNNVFDGESVEGYAFTGNIESDKLLIVDDGKIKPKKTKEFLKERQFSVYAYKGDMNLTEFYIDSLHKILNEDSVDDNYFFAKLTGFKPVLENQLDYDSRFELLDLEKFNKICELIESTIVNNLTCTIDNSFKITITNPKELRKCNNILEGSSGISISQDLDGYFLHQVDGLVRSKSYPKLDKMHEDNVATALYALSYLDPKMLGGAK